MFDGLFVEPSLQLQDESICRAFQLGHFQNICPEYMSNSSEANDPYGWLEL